MNKITRMKSGQLLLLSASLLYATYLLNVRWLTFFSFTPIFLCLKRSNRPIFAASYGYAFGVAFFILANFWLINVNLAFFVLLTLYEALFFLIFGIIIAVLFKKRAPILMVLLGVPSLWVALEFIRSLGFLGDPLGFAGYALTPYPILTQMASLFGVYGLSFFVIFINIATVIIFQRSLVLRKRIAILALGVIVFLGVVFFGNSELSRPAVTETIKVSVIQGNIAPDKKWSVDLLDNSISTYEGLSKEAVKDRPSLIIWPETAVPCFLFHPARSDVLERIEGIARSVRTPVLTGAQDFIIDDAGKHAYNAAALFSGTGDVAGIYRKIKLVPLVEEVPQKWMMPIARKLGTTKSYDKGAEYGIFKIKDHNFSTLICFEGIFPDLVRHFITKNTHFVVNITNDQPSLGSMSLFYKLNKEMLKIRAIENRRSFVRAANNGVSVFIDPMGRIIKELQPFTSGYLTTDVPMNRTLTLYNRAGYLFPQICLLITIFALLIRTKR